MFQAMAEPIRSRKNAIVAQMRALRGARDGGLLFLEGRKLVAEALSSGLSLDVLVCTPEAEAEAGVKRLMKKAKRCVIVTEGVFAAFSDVECPQGVLAAVKRPEWSWTDLTKRGPGPIIILDGLQHPGNMATVVRTAEAAGAAGIVTTKESARIFSPKALRGAAGSSLRLPCLEHRLPREIAEKIKSAGYRILLAAAAGPGKNSVSYEQTDWSRPCAVVFGREGQGVSAADWKGLAQEYVHIPMRAPSESLNVASAAAVILYEAARRRGF